MSLAKLDATAQRWVASLAMDSAMATIKTSHTVTLTGTTASTRLETKDTMPAHTAK